MARLEECDHEMAYVLCPLCDEGDPLLPEERSASSRAEMSGPVVARYHSPCPHCQEDVYGRAIALEKQGAFRRWVCADCVL